MDRMLRGTAKDVTLPVRSGSASDVLSGFVARYAPEPTHIYICVSEHGT